MARTVISRFGVEERGVEGSVDEGSVESEAGSGERRPGGAGTIGGRSSRGGVGEGVDLAKRAESRLPVDPTARPIDSIRRSGLGAGVVREEVRGMESSEGRETRAKVGKGEQGKEGDAAPLTAL